MARIFHPKIVSANDLLLGDVVYKTSSAEWSRDHDQAMVFLTKEEADKALAKSELENDKVVGPYLADAWVNEDGKPEPIHFREAFRTRGPSNYPDHGKQAVL